MIYLKLMLAVFFPIIIGHSLLVWIIKKDHPPIERAASAFVLGSGIISTVMTLCLLLSVKISLAAVLIPCSGFVLIAAIVLRKRFFDFKISVKIQNAVSLVLLALIILQLCFIFSEALLRPVYTWDALQNWIYRAKLLYYDRDSARLAGSSDYPMQVPLFFLWFSIVFGGWNDQLPKIIFPLYFLCMLGMFYSVLRQKISQTNALFFTYLLSTLPLLAYHATIEYADLTIAVFYFFAAANLYLYFEKNESGMLVLSAFFAGLAALIKTEGAFYFLALIAVLLVHSALEKKGFKHIIKYGAAGFIWIIPWVLLSYRLKLISGNAIFPGEPYTAGILGERLAVVFSSICNKMFFEGNWHVAWFSFIIVLVLFFGRIRKSNAKYLFILTAFNLGILILVFTATEMHSWLYGASVSFNRVVLHFMPVMMLWAGLAIDWEEK